MTMVVRKLKVPCLNFNVAVLNWDGIEDGNSGGGA
jgi:hypothetical protein